MTTIAGDFRAGVMACDSRLQDDVIWLPCTKIYRIGGVLIGCAGDVAEIGRYLQWFKAGRKGKTPKLINFAALLLRDDGLYDVTDDCHEQIVERGFHAVGSGAHAAVAAFILGFDAHKAVETACQIDTKSGGEIRVFHLKESQ